MRGLDVTQVRPGVSKPEAVIAHLPAGTPVRPLPVVTMTATRRLQEDLDEWEQQIHSWTWFYDAARIRAVVAGVRAEAARRGWPLDREAELTRQIQWWAFGGAAADATRAGSRRSESERSSGPGDSPVAEWVEHERGEIRSDAPRARNREATGRDGRYNDSASDDRRFRDGF
jgi:hypothetical protein